MLDQDLTVGRRHIVNHHRAMFKKIVGNHALCRRLGEDILSRRLPHALILEGPCGTGKHTIARMCAAALVCSEAENEAYPLPCLSCLPCKKVLEYKSPDVITLGCDGKASIGVETARFLREDVSIVPNDSDFKVYIIEDADKMTTQAQNALLLTLEEPPSYVHFFLLCENSALLLETIRSRAPVFRTEPISAAEMDGYLCEHDSRARSMKASDPMGYAELLIAAGAGIGRALEYLDPKVFAPVLAKRALASAFTESAVNGCGADGILPLLSRFSTKRELLRDQLAVLSQAIRDLILLKKSEAAPLCFYANREAAIELCDHVSLQFLYNLADAVRQAENSNARNANVRLTLIKMALDANLL